MIWKARPHEPIELLRISASAFAGQRVHRRAAFHARARASVSEKLKAWPPPSRDALFTHRDTRSRSLTMST